MAEKAGSGSRPRSSRRSRAGRLVLLLACICLAPVARAQDDEVPDPAFEENRILLPDQRSVPGLLRRGLEVSVVDYAGPVAGATVVLENERGEFVEGETGAEGAIRLFPDRPGRWNLRVEADGHLPSEGVVLLPQTMALEVEVRSLDATSPRFAEGRTDGEVRDWLSRGETLLAEGRPGAARAELERALPHLDRSSRAEVRTTIARTWWLEGERRRSLEELEEALRLDADAEAARQVYAGLMEAVGRGDEVAARLAALAAEEPRATMDTAVAGVDTPAPEASAARADAVGDHVFRFSRRHPRADMDTVVDRLGYPEEERAGQQPLDLAEESFDVIVPAAFASRAAGESWGVVVWISPGSRGGLRPDAEARDLLAERRLLWVGANAAGNPRPYWQRVALALHAAENAVALWDVDPARVIVAGYSGGGRVASMAAWLWPGTFSAGVFWMGTDFWEAVPVPWAPGRLWPASFPRPDRASLRRVREHSRLALVTGDLDFNRSGTRAVHRRLGELGYDRHVYLQIPGADHYAGLSLVHLRQALEYVDPLD